ncbi:MAG TPA: hypothetical protein VK900_18915 [Anaerolineales bacterium]|nr:hypothetical protein [Anaerolineales bacterium]
MVTKHVILANDSRLLREMLRRVIAKANHLEVVQEIAQPEQLGLAIEHFEPGWVILSSPEHQNSQGWINSWLLRYPSVGFVVLSADHGRIMIQSQNAEQDLAHLSLREFIEVLERDLPHN